MSGPPKAAYSDDLHVLKVPGPYLNSPLQVNALLLKFPSLASEDLHLAHKVCLKVRKFMERHDNSHDYEHIQRVVANAYRIWISDPAFQRDLDPLVVFLGCLMHDVGDHKYLKFWESGEHIKERMLIKCGISKELARKVQIIASHVSYTKEKRDPGAVLKVRNEYPELAIVQDADRLDALGAVGQARTFAYHGASRRFRRTSLFGAVQYQWHKLYELPGMMKTAYGREEGQRLWEWNEEFGKIFAKQASTLEVLDL